MKTRSCRMGSWFTLCALLGLSACGGDWSVSKESEAGWLSFNQNLIRSRLKEPSRAEFSHSFVAQAEGSPVVCVCGDVDEKDRHGAVLDHQRYISCGSATQPPGPSGWRPTCTQMPLCSSVRSTSP